MQSALMEERKEEIVQQRTSLIFTGPRDAV